MSLASNLDFPGGIEQIEIADADDFDTSANSEFAITIERNRIAEGIDVPDPEKVTAALADDRELGMGVNQEINLRFTAMDTTDYDSLKQARNEGTEVFIRITSVKTNDAGDPAYEITYQNAIINHTAHAPVQSGRDSYGVVIVEAMTTGGDSDDIYSLTQN